MNEHYYSHKRGINIKTNSLIEVGVNIETKELNFISYILEEEKIIRNSGAEDNSLLIGGIVGGVAAIIVIALIIICCIKKKQQEDKEKEKKAQELEEVNNKEKNLENGTKYVNNSHEDIFSRKKPKFVDGVTPDPERTNISNAEEHDNQIDIEASNASPPRHIHDNSNIELLEKSGLNKEASFKSPKSTGLTFGGGKEITNDTHVKLNDSPKSYKESKLASPRKEEININFSDTPKKEIDINSNVYPSPKKPDVSINMSFAQTSPMKDIHPEPHTGPPAISATPQIQGPGRNRPSAKNINANLSSPDVKRMKDLMDKINKEPPDNLDLDENINDIIKKNKNEVNHQLNRPFDRTNTENSRFSENSAKEVQILNNENLIYYSNDGRSQPNDSYFLQNEEQIKQDEKGSKNRSSLRLSLELKNYNPIDNKILVNLENDEKEEASDYGKANILSSKFDVNDREIMTDFDENAQKNRLDDFEVYKNFDDKKKKVR